MQKGRKKDGQARKTKTNYKFKNELGRLLSFFLLLFTAYLAFVESKDISAFAEEGIKLCFECIIPSIFPFLIITDFYLAYGHPEKLKLLCAAVSKIFGTEKEGASALICGFLTGFPIGVKTASELYIKGRIKKDSAELLCAIGNLPSPSFVVAAVSASIGIGGGITVMTCVYLSALVTGVIFRVKTTKNNISYDITRQKFDLVTSIKNAGTSVIGISSYIIFFSALTGIIRKYIKDTYLLYFALPFFEMTNAVSFVLSSNIFL